MPKNKAPIFKACAKAIVAFHGSGKNTDQQLETVRKTRKLLHWYIVELAAKDEIVFPRVLNALGEAYLNPAEEAPEPTKEYCVDMMIRNIADVCRTLKRMSEGKERSDSNKILIAKALCVALHDLLK